MADDPKHEIHMNFIFQEVTFFDHDCWLEFRDMKINIKINKETKKARKLNY